MKGCARPVDFDHRRQDPTLFEVDEGGRVSARRSTRTPTSSWAQRSTRLDGVIRVSVVATGIDSPGPDGAAEAVAQRAG